MADLSESEKKDISKFIEYSLMLILRGFDEMEMDKRLDLVKMLGSVIDIGLNKLYFRISDLEKRITDLEEKNSE